MDHDDPLDRRREKRRRQSRSRVAVAAVLVGVMLAAGATVAVVAARQRHDGGAFGHPADVWTYKEMAGHLQGHEGFKGWQYRPHGPHAIIYPPGATSDAGSIAAAVVDASLENGLPMPRGVVHFRKMPDAESARQYAGHTNRPAMAYQSWVLLADEPTMATVRAALH